MNRRLAALGLVALVAAAGCLGPGGDEESEGPAEPAPGDPSDENRTDQESGTGTEAEDSQAPEPLAEPRSTTLHLSPERELTNESVANGSVPIAGGPSGFAMDDPPTTFESEPHPGAFLVNAETVTLELWLQAQTASASKGQVDLAVWFGSTRGINLLQVHSMEEQVITSGEPVLVEVELPFDEARSLVVPDGEQLRLLLFTPNDDENVENLEILTGGDTASRLELTTSSFGVDPMAGLGPVNETTREGTIPANAPFVDCDLEEGLTTQYHSLKTVEDAGYLELTLEATQAPEDPDLDMVLLDGDQTVMATHSPTARENILLAGPTLLGLGDTELTLQVNGCSAHNTDYEVTIQQASSTASVGWSPP